MLQHNLFAIRYSKITGLVKAKNSLSHYGRVLLTFPFTLRGLERNDHRVFFQRNMKLAMSREKQKTSKTCGRIPHH